MSSDSIIQTVRRARLCDRLELAAGVLDHQKEADLAESVREAIAVIKALPFTRDINDALYPPRDKEPKQ